MNKNPYLSQSDLAFWSRSVSRNFAAKALLGNQNGESLFKLNDKVVSAGSCFASNLIPWIEKEGLEYLRTDELPPQFQKLPENLGYRNFSAAYGNIYTARHLRQLYEQALGLRKPIEDRWYVDDHVIDPYRPGLAYPAESDAEFDLIRSAHLSAVKKVFHSATVFVFTLGLTEAWVSKEDGSVFPACPGTISGVFDEAKHEFKNFTVSEVTDDLTSFISLLRKSNENNHKLITAIVLMVIACYFVDAFFNFPAERTSMQTMFALSAALLFLPIYFTDSNNSKQKEFKGAMLLFIPLLLVAGAIYVNYQTYTSLKVQKYVMGEINEDPKMALDDVKDAFPEIPNLSTSTLPIKALVARYYLRDKMNEEAMRLLNESENVNPYLHYNDFIRTAIFSTQGKFDSTFYYAKKAFYNWPRATSYYKNMIFASAKMKDTAEATKAFKTYIKYRNSGEGWNQYILGLIEINQTPIAQTRALLDTAISKFPADSAIFVNTKSLLYGNAISTGTLPNYAALGAQAFQKGKYTVAANYYLQASVAEPSNYTHFENMGICYYTAKSFEKAIQYFNRAIDLPSANTGKSEFFKAMSYIAIGNKAAGCSALQAAKAKNYPGVDEQIAQYCK